MILPTVLLLVAVVALVGLVNAESLPSQVVAALWAILGTIGAAQTSTDESVTERRRLRHEARELKRLSKRNG